MDGFQGPWPSPCPRRSGWLERGCATSCGLPDRRPGRAGRAGRRRRRGAGDHADGGPHRAPGLHRVRGRRRPVAPPRDPGMPGHRRGICRLRRQVPGGRPPLPHPRARTGRRPGRRHRQAARLPAGRASWPTRRRSPESATTRRATAARAHAIRLMQALSPARADRAPRPRSSTPSARSPTWSSSTAAAPAPSRRPYARRPSPRSPPDPGFFHPRLFDFYRGFTGRPAALFALPVVRRPAPGRGHRPRRRLPRLRRRRARTAYPSPTCRAGLRYDADEGAGEVQTPLLGQAAEDLRIGDRVWFRHAKAGELCERFATLHLVDGGTVADYRPHLPRRGQNLPLTAAAAPQHDGRAHHQHGPHADQHRRQVGRLLVPQPLRVVAELHRP